MGILGTERRALPPAQMSQAVSSLFARVTQHVEPSDAESERTWPSESLKVLDSPIQRLFLHQITALIDQTISACFFDS